MTIRWEDSGYAGGLCGFVGAMEPWAFQIWTGGDRTKYQLLTALPIVPAGTERPESADPAALKAEAEKLLAKFITSLGAIFPGDADRTYIHWAVAYGCPSGDPNEAAGILEYDDEEEAREHLQWVHDSFLARRTVTSTRWERVEAGTPPAGEATR